jgi:hypothetical protein
MKVIKLKTQEKPAPFETRLQKAFPGSYWVEDAPSEAPSRAIAVIGGAKFDEAELVKWLRALPRDTILVTTAPRFKKDGEPYAGDFGGALQILASAHQIRVDFVEQREAYGTYAKAVQLGTILQDTGGDVVAVGPGGDPKYVRGIASGDWAIRKAKLGDRQVVDIG